MYSKCLVYAYIGSETFAGDGEHFCKCLDISGKAEDKLTIRRIFPFLITALVGKDFVSKKIIIDKKRMMF